VLEPVQVPEASTCNFSVYTVVTAVMKASALDCVRREPSTLNILILWAIAQVGNVLFLLFAILKTCSTEMLQSLFYEKRLSSSAVLLTLPCPKRNHGEANRYCFSQPLTSEDKSEVTECSVTSASKK
jgi:hypothetical protein